MAFTSPPPPPPDAAAQAIRALAAELEGYFTVDSVAPQGGGQLIAFSGRLTADAAGSYDEIRRRFGRHGYTPLLRHEAGQDVVVALEGLVERSRTGSPLVNLLLLAATILTTLAAGAALERQNLWQAVRSGSPETILGVVLAGAPFAVALLGILGVHELGHYFAAQYHRVRATLPYFIPMPVGGLGTLGAFIAIRSPMKDRCVLFDIGLAGPYAGLLVAVPLLVLGLALSDQVVPLSSRDLTLERLGSSLLIDGMVRLFTDLPPGSTLRLHPVLYAAWLGFFLTGINLLPVGQLDGGHAAYALLGRYAHYLGIAVFIGLLIAGTLLSPNWYVWAFFIMLGGLRHPPPLNDVTRLGPGRQLVGLFSILLFILIVTPAPFGN